MIHEKVNHLSPTLSKDIQAAYAENINRYNESLAEVLKRGFKMSETEIFDMLSANEQSSHSFCNLEIKYIFGTQTNRLLLSNFNENFKKNEKGTTYEWRDLEEKDIMTMYE